MAKRSKKTTLKRLTRKQLSRKAKEERQQRFLYFGAALLAVLVLGVLGIGLYQEYVAKPAQPVARVAGVPIRDDRYRKMVAYRELNLQNTLTQLQTQLQRANPDDKNQEFIIQYYQQQIESTQKQLEQAPELVLNEMIDDELIRQEAERLGISVSDEEVQSEIEKQFGYDRNPPTPTPTPITATASITLTPTPTTAPMTEEDFQESYANVVAQLEEKVKFSEQDIRDLFRAGLLRDKLEQHLADQVPTSGPQVHARHILLETEEDAKKALARLKAGEDFATVAAEMTTDEGTRESGGDLGWFPQGRMVPEFEKAAFNTPVGKISDIVQTNFGFHIIKVEERDENREFDPDILAEKRRGVLDKWLEEKRGSEEDIERFLKFGSATPPAG